jgi:hypothetical protein
LESAAHPFAECCIAPQLRLHRPLQMTKNLLQRDQTLKNNLFTVAPVELSDCTKILAEWGDHQTIYRIFSIKRGLLYELDRLKLVTSVSLRRPGQKFSKRLWSVQSIRDYLNSRREAQSTSQTQTGG